MHDQYQQLKEFPDYFPPKGGKKYRLMLSEITGSRRVFVVGDFDEISDAQKQAETLFDKQKYRLSINQRCVNVIQNAGSADSTTVRETYTASQPISVSALCGLAPKKRAYRRRRW